MGRERWYNAGRIAFALLALAAIVTQLAIQLDKPDPKVANFFSFFTIQSNILALVMLIVAGVLGLRGIVASERLEQLRGGAVAYMATTGIVYDLLLADIQADLQLTEPWVDWVLHRLMPVVMAVDWLAAPPARRLEFRSCLQWIGFPIAYCIYSLIRGAIVDWYPYPFLDPRETGGYPGVIASAIGIAVLFVGLVWLVATLGNLARSWWTGRTATAEAGA